MTNVTEENYYTQEIDREWFSASQFKAFLKCESEAMSELMSEERKEPSEAMLVGSYFDAMIQGDDERERFEQEHSEIFLKNGEDLKAPYRHAHVMLERALRDDLWREFAGVDGGSDKQVILTGEIEGVSYKGAIDVLNDIRIVDIKTTRSFDKVWSNDLGTYTSFAHAYGYDIQGAIYQELVRQQTGKLLPFYLVAVTKEEIPDIAIFEIDSSTLADTLEMVKLLTPRFAMVKAGIEPPRKCGRCKHCLETKKLEDILDWRDYRG